VALVVAAGRALAERGLPARVVSMPSRELFLRQPRTYRDQVLPPGVPRLAVEAGVTLGWREVVGDRGAVLGVDRFGASAPGKVVAERLGLTVDAVVAKALELVAEA
jgi:transketolase